MGRGLGGGEWAVPCLRGRGLDEWAGICVREGGVSVSGRDPGQ